MTYIVISCRSNKMKSRYTIGIATLVVLVLLSVNFVFAMPFNKGQMNSDLTEEQKAEMQEQRESMRTAIESEDYESWKVLMEEKVVQMQARITEENFNLRLERHQERAQFREAMEEARETGDYSEVDILKEELGIKGKGFGMGNRGNNPNRAQNSFCK